MINNRQGGRRRGRGGQGGGRNLGGQPGNRQDNRQRGNAAQLLEKYKSMARDAQLSGDRVQTEYYLQYADHYFRVLGESRARFEDQNPRRNRDEEFEGEEESGSSINDAGFQRGDEEPVEAGQELSEDERPYRQQGRDRFERSDRPNRGDSRDRSGRDASNAEPRQLNGAVSETIPFDALPPAIGRDEPPASETVEEEPRRPRRRARAPRPADGDEGEVAPAA